MGMPAKSCSFYGIAAQQTLYQHLEQHIAERGFKMKKEIPEHKRFLFMPCSGSIPYFNTSLFFFSRPILMSRLRLSFFFILIIEKTGGDCNFMCTPDIQKVSSMISITTSIKLYTSIVTEQRLFFQTGWWMCREKCGSAYCGTYSSTTPIAPKKCSQPYRKRFPSGGWFLFHRRSEKKLPVGIHLLTGSHL